MLKENGAPPAAGRWADIAVLEPVRDYKARHASTLLTFDAVVSAIDQIAAKRARASRRRELIARTPGRFRDATGAACAALAQRRMRLRARACDSAPAAALLAAGFQLAEAAGKTGIADPDGGLRLAGAIGSSGPSRPAPRRRTRGSSAPGPPWLATDFSSPRCSRRVGRADLERLDLILDDQLDLGDVARQVAVGRPVADLRVGHGIGPGRLGAG